ncbi:ceramidase domain-containing protein [uncultured Lamprocystis sp.]|jgi:hypothetical protein|uniref:ceramidase domain-containing protein n=1 Tax=uncultured Lamprocystis sp. TaxID=543132 RepID=UPI0025FA6E08|nr:ceramidase domain-containing protein [uncultured Lamprocystis sp.]
MTFSLYCERTQPGLLDEPLNLVTNVAFVIAGLFAAWRWREQEGLTLKNGWELALLIGLLFAIGIGSALFHAFANGWSLLADVVPILLFINLYLICWLYRVAAAPVWAILAIFGVYQGINYGAALVLDPSALNGSAGYLPALLFLASMWLWLWWRRHVMVKTLGLATGLFALSLTFRTIDQAVCAVVPTGSHFLWHLLNGLLLYLLVSGLIRHSDGRFAHCLSPEPLADMAGHLKAERPSRLTLESTDEVAASAEVETPAPPAPPARTPRRPARSPLA